MCLYQVHVGSHGGQKRVCYVLDALELGLQVLMSQLIQMMGLDSGPLEERQVLLATESSLQPPRNVF